MKIKLLSLTLTLILTTTVFIPFSILAEQSVSNDKLENLGMSLEDYTKIQQIADDYSITVDELVNLNENINNAFDEMKKEKISIKGDDIYRTQISENLFMEISTSLIQNFNQERVGYNGRATLELKNVLGITVVTLNSNGSFDVNGNTVTPTDAYGTYSGFLWKLDYIDSYKSSPSSTAYFRNTFKGELNVGVDSLHITIQSFRYSGTFYLDYSLNYWSDWF